MVDMMKAESSRLASSVVVDIGKAESSTLASSVYNSGVLAVDIVKAESSRLASSIGVILASSAHPNSRFIQTCIIYT